ncbi:MAG: metallophosphoesterase [Myxococcales bacterium]|nr:metallophosphoesterase [Myxococcales bacterium]
MSRLGGIVLFLVFALSIIGGLHYYFWARLVRDTALPAPWRQLATGLFWFLGFSMPVSMVLWRSHHPLRGLVAWPAFIWMGMILILSMVLVGSDVVKLAVRAGGGLRDPERRLMFQRVLGAAAATLSAGLGALALREGTKRVGVRNVDVVLPRLPKALDGFTIVQITDVHVGGQTLHRAFIEEIVATTNALGADLIAVTGDLVDGSVDALRDQVAPLGQLKSKHGTFFVTGNHEYYAGADEWIAHLPSLGIKVLRNERVTIGSGDDSFDLAGVDDYNSRGVPGHGPNLARALHGRDDSRELVLLAHQPRAIHEAAASGVGLQLSGHTHGGQIWPWSFAVRLQQPYVAGLARHKETQLYVSRGTGYWGPPMRLGAPAEITRIRLHAA